MPTPPKAVMPPLVSPTPAARAGAGGYSAQSGGVGLPTTNAASADMAMARVAASTLGGGAAPAGLQESAATKIQAQVRRRRDSDSAQYEFLVTTMSQMESKEEHARLQANRSFARAAAILESEAESHQHSGMLGAPGSSPTVGVQSFGLRTSDGFVEFGRRPSLFELPGQNSSAWQDQVADDDDDDEEPMVGKNSIGGPSSSKPKLPMITRQATGPLLPSEALASHQMLEDAARNARAIDTEAPIKDGLPRITFVPNGNPKGGVGVTRQSIDDVLHHFKQKGAEPIDAGVFKQLIVHVTEILRNEVKSALLEISTPPSPGQCVVLGDTHGQLADVLWIFFKNGEPSESNVYLFNGDVADRGPNALSIFVLILLFKLNHPDSIHLNRGNHEDRSMNETYGFLEECVKKYGYVQGLELFELFNVMFEHLPLYTLIDGNVFVVHGGLWRFTYNLTQLRRANFRRPCPDGGAAAAAPADALLFDSLWADPQVTKGYGMSARGSNIVTFGPDITANFLKANKLRLVVRSHEVPSNGRGYLYQHNGKCLTIFSASNYCGQCGNLGGVLLLTQGQDDLIEEHWAPDIEEFITIETDAKNARRRLSEALQVQRTRRRAASEAMEAELLRRVRELVVKHKTALFEYWSLVDMSPRGVFTITAAEWREGCAAVMGNNLPWFKLQEYLQVTTRAGMVHYVKFLARYRVVYEGGHGLVSSGWERAVWSKMMESLLRADLPLREALAALDSTNNGVVSPNEFARLLDSCGVGISSSQARALLRTFAAQGWVGPEGSEISSRSVWEVSLWDVLARLQVSLPVTATPANSKEAELAAWAVPYLRPLATVVLDDAWRRLADSNASVAQWPAARLLAVWFEDADRSHNGYLECDEFVDALEALRPQLERAGCPADRASLAKIGRHCDIMSLGRINYFELLNGLTWEDALGPEFEQDLLETINSSVYFNASTIRRALLRFDPENSGVVRIQDFVMALRAVFSSLAAEEGSGTSPITRQQIETIARNIPKYANDRVDYDRFLNSFTVVDSECDLHDRE